MNLLDGQASSCGSLDYQANLASGRTIREQEYKESLRDKFNACIATRNAAPTNEPAFGDGF